jgi:hypothetical protein
MPDSSVQAYHSRARVPHQLCLCHLQAVEVTTRANTDKKARSKQRTRKAIVPLSTADDARDDTYDDDKIGSRRRRLRRRRRRCLRGRPTDLAAQEGEGIR